MKTKTIRSVCILMLAAALCLFMAACGDKSESPDASPEPSSTPAPVTDVSTPGSGVIISESTETAAPTPDPTPEPSREPTTVKLQYDGSDVTELSFLSSAVFQLRAITNDGSTGGAWTSSDASSASVDENGVVTCWKGGSPPVRAPEAPRFCYCSGPGWRRRSCIPDRCYCCNSYPDHYQICCYNPHHGTDHRFVPIPSEVLHSGCYPRCSQGVIRI